MDLIQVNEALAMNTGGDLEGWCVIERAVHDGRMWLERVSDRGMALRTSARISDADVEGTAFDMLRIAEAIEKRGEASEKRCAVRVAGDSAYFWSPRNSESEAMVPLVHADALAAEIRMKLQPKALGGGHG